MRIIAKIPSIPMQTMNDLHFVLHSECDPLWSSGDWTFVIEKGWEHHRPNREMQLGLTFDYLDREGTFTVSVVHLLFWRLELRTCFDIFGGHIQPKSKSRATSGGGGGGSTRWGRAVCGPPSPLKGICRT